MNGIDKVVWISQPQHRIFGEEWVTEGLRGALALRGVAWETAQHPPARADRAVYLLHCGRDADEAELTRRYGTLDRSVAERTILDETRRGHAVRLLVSLRLAGALDGTHRAFYGRSDLFDAVLPGQSPGPMVSGGQPVTDYACYAHPTLSTHEKVAAFIEKLGERLG